MNSIIDSLVSLPVKEMFGPDSSGPKEFGPFGDIIFPYRSFGAVNTVDLFNINELNIFAFYWSFRHRYSNVADIGANVGLHSLILHRCGYNVRSYEPDPLHIMWMRDMLSANGIHGAEITPAAVSDREGEAEFIRVLGNTTGSHIAGAKKNPYGELERFRVSLVPFSDVLKWAHLVKIDAEGSEDAMILSTTADQWKDTDAILEIGTYGNAETILGHLKRIGINIFSPKIGWGLASKVEDLPHSHKEGLAFISSRESLWPT